MKPLMLTFTGRNVNPLDLRPEDICIEDIAHALALCNRFAGHTGFPISVAQHSVYVSQLCENNLVEAMQGLLHDASEAYLGDMIKWVKESEGLAAYREAEDRAQRIIYEYFGCPPVMSDNVAAADKLMLRLEGEQGYGHKSWCEWLKRVPPSYCLITEEEQKKIGVWKNLTWEESEKAFHARFHFLVEKGFTFPGNLR